MGVGDRIDSWESGITAWLRRLWLLSKVGVAVGALLLVLFLVLNGRDLVQSIRERWRYGDGTAPGHTAQETKDSEKAEKVPLDVQPPAWRVARGGAAPTPEIGRIVTQRLEGDAARAHEERTGLDVTGDGLVGNRSAAEVDQEKLEHGGKQGKADVEAGPASDPWVPVKSVRLTASGRRASTADGDVNLRTGEFRLTHTLDRAGRVTWPNEFELELWLPVGGPGRAEGWGVYPDEWNGKLSWTPLAVKGVLGIALGVDYDELRPDGDEIRYLVGARLRCHGFRTCESY